MTDHSDKIGLPTMSSKIEVERGPVSKFASSCTDENPIYHNLEAAKAAGFDNIPASPTYSFCSPYWGVFSEDQPEDPTNGNNPMMEIMGQLMGTGGMILHGEQEFTYHQPIQVGETLHLEGKLVDYYSKESKGKTMTFIVTENIFTNDAGEPVVTERFNLIHRI